ncbi:MAG: hypothetical protein KJ985_14150 [Proteobacteria bacterium]|nr:hypothetical protein [Pseudomonadota bacterium]
MAWLAWLEGLREVRKVGMGAASCKAGAQEAVGLGKRRLQTGRSGLFIYLIFAP